MQHFFIGVDGGATKSTVRIEDDAGKLLGQEISGPANIRISVDQAWQSIHAALTTILRPLAISLDDSHHHFHAGMGLAGCEMPEAYQAFQERSHSFHTLIVSSDAHAACIGAHGGDDGAIIIAGTGVVGYQIQFGQTTKVAGWGFPHDDEGGGAWLGLRAVNVTLQWLDGRLPSSELAKRIYAHFAADLHRFISWTNRANSTAFAELAPLVIQCAATGDPVAIRLLQEAAHAVDHIAQALLVAQAGSAPLPCSLVGSIATFLEPHLGMALRSRLRPCQLTPDMGAVLLVREYLATHEGYT